MHKDDPENAVCEDCINTLSDKIYQMEWAIDGQSYRAICVKDVKEFISKLKEDAKMGMLDVDGDNHIADHWDIHDLIDKLSGEKLI